MELHFFVKITFFIPGRVDGCWSTRTFTNSYFGQLGPNKLVLYFSLVNSYFMPLVNSYFIIGQLVQFDWLTRTL